MNAGSTVSIAASSSTATNRKHRTCRRRHLACRSIRLRCHDLRLGRERQSAAAFGRKPGDVLYVSGPLGGWRHKRVIVPRLEFGRKLVGIATACMDISDGLALDLHRLCKASGVAAELENVPLLKGATLDQALHDGEDYELLFTAPAARKSPRHPDRQHHRKANPARYDFEGQPLKPIGYDHTRQNH